MMFEKSNHLIFGLGWLFAAGCARTNKEIVSRVNEIRLTTRNQYRLASRRQVVFEAVLRIDS
jgi:hypothetical protein